MTEPRPRTGCPRDMDGDGDCGRPLCPHCGYAAKGQAAVDARQQLDRYLRETNADLLAANDPAARYRVDLLREFVSTLALAMAIEGASPDPGTRVLNRVILACVPQAADVAYRREIERRMAEGLRLGLPLRLDLPGGPVRLPEDVPAEGWGK